MEERGEGADDDLRAIERKRVDQPDCLTEGVGRRAARGGDALGIGLLVGSLSARVALVGADRGAHELIEDVADICIVFAQDAALEAQEQRKVVAQLPGMLISPSVSMAARASSVSIRRTRSGSDGPAAAACSVADCGLLRSVTAFPFIGCRRSVDGSPSLYAA